MNPEKIGVGGYLAMSRFSRYFRYFKQGSGSIFSNGFCITHLNTKISTENCWLEDEMSFKMVPFQDMLIFRGGGG